MAADQLMGMLPSRHVSTHSHTFTHTHAACAFPFVAFFSSAICRNNNWTNTTTDSQVINWYVSVKTAFICKLKSVNIFYDAIKWRSTEV